MKLILAAVIRALCISLLLFIACGENLYNLGNNTPREIFQIGKRYFFKGDYNEAQIVFEQVARLNIIAEYSDSVQFLLAESYFNVKKYVLAQSEYERLIKNLPRSQLLPKAKYMVGMCYFNLSPSEQLDQVYTNNAIKAFEEFLRAYRSQADEQLIQDAGNRLGELYEKLAEKDFKAGVLYKKMDDYFAAIQYLNDSMTKYNTYGPAPTIPKALFEKGECYIKLIQFPEAQDAFQALVDNFPQHVLVNRAREKLASLKTEIAKRDTVSLKNVK